MLQDLWYAIKILSSFSLVLVLVIIVILLLASIYSIIKGILTDED